MPGPKKQIRRCADTESKPNNPETSPWKTALLKKLSRRLPLFGVALQSGDTPVATAAEIKEPRSSRGSAFSKLRLTLSHPISQVDELFYLSSFVSAFMWFVRLVT